ncbi:hypothetical protein GCM10009664_33210 [Kitasatospora gansuensis]
MYAFNDSLSAIAAVAGYPSVTVALKGRQAGRRGMYAAPRSEGRSARQPRVSSGDVRCRNTTPGAAVLRMEKGRRNHTALMAALS